MDFLIKLDIRIFNFINQKIRCKFLDFAMPSITSLGNTVPVIVMSFIIMYLSKVPAMTFFINVVVVVLFCTGIKYIVKRMRPHISLPIIKLSEKFDYYDPSFPSAHTASVSAIGATLSFYYTALFPLAILTTIAMAISRIYLGQHYPSDTIIGGLIGWVFALVGCGF